MHATAKNLSPEETWASVIGKKSGKINADLSKLTISFGLLVSLGQQETERTSLVAEFADNDLLIMNNNCYVPPNLHANSAFSQQMM